MTTSPIQALYLAFFQRPADAAGLDYWNSVYAASGSSPSALVAIAASFANSPEFGGLIAGKPVGDVVDALYTGLFGRPADPGGLQYWRAAFLAGNATYAQMGVAILQGAQSLDSTAVDNRVAVANLFTSTVRSGATYDGLQDTANARNFLKLVTADTNTVYSASQITAFVQNYIADPSDALFVPTTPTLPAGQSFTLTAGTDTVVGGEGDDTITGAGAGMFASPDSVLGGAGTDRLTVSDSTAMDTAGTTVLGVEAASLTSSSTVAATTTGWTGLSQLSVTGVGSSAIKASPGTAVNLTLTGQTALATIDGAGAVTATVAGAGTGKNLFIGGSTPVSGAVTVNSTYSGTTTAGVISVTGGTVVNVTQTAANPVNTTANMGNVSISGRSTTTSVTVTNSPAATASAGTAGVNSGAVQIDDINKLSATLAGTITSATLSNFTAAIINDNALATLNLTGGSSNVAIGNSGLTVPTNRTLGLTINGQTGGTLSDSGVYTTLNVTATGADSSLANIAFAGLTALNVAGSKLLLLTSSAGLSQLQTVTVSGSAGLAADLSGATITKVDASASSGTNIFLFDASKAGYTGGSGVDMLQVTSATATQAISLGDGDDSLLLGTASVPTGTIDGGNGTDTLGMYAGLAATASGSGALASKVTHFERLLLISPSNQTVDLAVLGNFSYVSNYGTGPNGLTLSNLPSGGTVVLTTPGTALTIDNSAFTAGPNDVVNLGLTDNSGAATAFASTGITAADVETFNITTGDMQATPSGAFNDSVTVLGNSVKTITVSGNAGLALTAASTALTSVDASGITLGGFSWTAGVLAGASTVKGSPTGANIFDGSAATVAAITYTGGSGSDTVKIGATASGHTNTVNVGTGIDTIVLTGIQADSAALTTVTGMGAGDLIDFASVTNGSADTGQATLGAAVPDQGTYSATLDLAAIGDGSATSIIKWFQTGGNTYVLLDTSSAANFAPSADSVIKLVGLVNLSTSAVAANVITL